VCGKDADVQSLQEILLYGVKGMAAYANHARRLGKAHAEKLREQARTQEFSGIPPPPE
jgi:hydroxylamine reductase (hybrid-cluster protein)